MRREDGAVRVAESNSVVESKATGVEIRLHPEVVASFGGYVAGPRRGGLYGTVGVRIRCLGPSKICSGRASSDAGNGKEKTGSCAVTGVASVQEGREERQARGRQQAM